MKQSIISLAFLLVYTVAVGQVMKCVENSCIPESDILDGQLVVQAVDKMPEYPGGTEAMFKHIAKNIRFHGSKNKLGGKMLVTFIVDTTGHVRDVCIVKSCFEEGVYYIEQEISDVFRQLAIMQPWEQKRKKVPVRVRLPIAF